MKIHNQPEVNGRLIRLRRSAMEALPLGSSTNYRFLLLQGIVQEISSELERDGCLFVAVVVLEICLLLHVQVIRQFVHGVYEGVFFLLVGDLHGQKTYKTTRTNKHEGKKGARRKTGAKSSTPLTLAHQASLL